MWKSYSQIDSPLRLAKRKLLLNSQLIVFLRNINETARESTFQSNTQTHTHNTQDLYKLIHCLKDKLFLLRLPSLSG